MKKIISYLGVILLVLQFFMMPMQAMALNFNDIDYDYICESYGVCISMDDIREAIEGMDDETFGDLLDSIGKMESIDDVLDFIEEHSETLVSDEMLAHVAELEKIISNVDEQLGNFRDWSNRYAQTLTTIMTVEVAKDLAPAISNKNYALAFKTISDALKESGEEEAANALVNLTDDFVDAIDELTTFVKEFTAYLDTDITVLDELYLMDSVKSIYETTEIKPVVTDILNIYSDVFKAYYEDVKDEIKSYGNMSVTELINLVSELEKKLAVYESFITSLIEAVDSYSELIGYAGLLVGIDTSIYEKAKSSVAELEELFIDTYNKFIEKQWAELEDEVSTIVGDNSKSILDRNQMLLDKIAYYTKLKNALKDTFDDLKVEIDDEGILDSIFTKVLARIERLENRTLSDLQDAIDYVEEHLMFDLILTKLGKENKVVIDRESKYLILDDNYELEDFKTFISLSGSKNDHKGQMVIDKPYEVTDWYTEEAKTVVGTKTKVNVNRVTGDKIEEISSYTIIVKGDVVANGEIDVTDVRYLIKAFRDGIQLDDITFRAGDMNNNKVIEVNDARSMVTKFKGLSE